MLFLFFVVNPTRPQSIKVDGQKHALAAGLETTPLGPTQSLSDGVDTGSRSSKFERRLEYLEVKKLKKKHSSRSVVLIPTEKNKKSCRKKIPRESGKWGAAVGGRRGRTGKGVRERERLNSARLLCNQERVKGNRQKLSHQDQPTRGVGGEVKKALQITAS